MNNLSYYEFKELLKYRTYNRNIRLNSLDRYSNCLKNSMWYYPDQLVPDTSQSINAHEFDIERKFYFEITFKKERGRHKNLQISTFLNKNLRTSGLLKIQNLRTSGDFEAQKDQQNRF